MSLAKKEAKNVARNLAIMFSPVILVILDELSRGNMDVHSLYKLALAAGISAIADGYRRYARIKK